MRNQFFGSSLLLALSLAALSGCQSTPPQETPPPKAEPPEQRVWAQLMFIGDAEEAMGLYTSSLPECEVVSIERYKEGEQGAGTVKQAVFSVMGQEVRCIDSPPAHEFTFTPSMSLFVNCRSAEEVDAVAAKLGEGGKVLMPLNEYPWSKRFTFITDRYGVSWQLNLPNE